MPFVKRQQYKKSPEIVAFNNGNYFTRSITLENKNVPLDDNDARTVPAGAIISEVNNNYRFLPRVNTTQNIATGATQLNVSNPFSLKIGDVLDVVLPYEIIEVGTAGSTGDTVTVTVNSDIVVTAYVTADENGDKVKNADLIASQINSNLQASRHVSAYSDGVDSVWVTAKNIFDRPSIAVSTSGVGVFNLIRNSGSIYLQTTSIGAITAIDRVNGTVTIDAPSGLSNIVPSDMPIGVRDANILGLICNDYDMTDKYVQNFALLTQSNGVYKNRLPYLDDDVESQLSQIVFGEKF